MLRKTALSVVLVGLAGSAALFFRAGQHSPPILIVLIGIWVLVPFAAMIATLVWSKRWPARVQSVLGVVTLVVTLGSVATYLYDAFHPRPQAAFWYVMVPPASVVVLTIALLAAWLLTRDSSRATRA